MTAPNPDDERNPPFESAPESVTVGQSEPRGDLLQGAVLCGAGIVLGAISLVLCCYAFGADFRGEGWGEQAAPSAAPRRIWFALSLFGFAIAIPLFWVGFYRLTHPELHSSSPPDL